MRILAVTTACDQDRDCQYHLYDHFARDPSNQVVVIAPQYSDATKGGAPALPREKSGRLTIERIYRDIAEMWNRPELKLAQASFIAEHFKPDIIWCWHENNFRLAHYLGSLTKAPVVPYLEIPSEEMMRIAYELKLPFVLSALLSDKHREQEHTRENTCFLKMEVPVDVPDAESLSRTPRINRGIFCGSLGYSYKGPEVFAQIVPKLFNETPMEKFLLVSPGNENAKRIVEALRQRYPIEQISSLPRKELFKEIASSFFSLTSTVVESPGSFPIESMALKTPVFSAGGSLGEVIFDLKTGIRTVESLRRLYEDPDLYSRIQDQAAGVYHGLFSAESVGNRCLEIFEAILEGRARGTWEKLRFKGEQTEGNSRVKANTCSTGAVCQSEAPLRIGIQLPIINTFDGAVWGDEVMAVGLAGTLCEQENVAFAEVYDMVTIHDNLDVIFHFYPFPILRQIKGPKNYWWYQAKVHPRVSELPEWKDYLSLYDGIFAASPTLKEHLIDWGVPPEKIAIMPMSCDLGIYRPRDPVSRYAHNIVFCANGAPLFRRPEDVQRCLLPLKDLGLRIYGSNWHAYPELRDCIEGPIPPSEVPLLYSSAKVVISNHTHWHFRNNLPTSRLWEALGCGAVVVSDHVPFAQDLFGDAVIWSEGFEDIRSKVEFLLTHESAREEIRGKGRKIIEERLSFQAYSPHLVEIFRSGQIKEFVSYRGGNDMLGVGVTRESQTPDLYGNGCSAAEWMGKGEDAFAAGNRAEAKTCFERALQLEPFQAKGHSNLSVVYWAEGNIEDALRSLTRALELDAEDQDVILNCANIFQSMGRAQDAIEIIEAYLERKPWDYEVKQTLDQMRAPAPMAHTPSPTPAAPAPGVQAPAIDDTAGFFNEQGEQQFEAAKRDHAKACFEMALEYDPNHAKAHNNLGVLYWQEGDQEKAMEHLYQALELDPEDSNVLYNSARALEAAGQLATAADYMRLYLQRSPQDESAWDDYTNLIQTLSAHSWKPDGHSVVVADIYARLGTELREAGDLFGAGEALHRSLQLNGTQANSYYELGKIHHAMGQSSEAVSMLSEALRLDAGHKAAVLALADILASQGRLADARSVFQDYLAHHEDVEIQKAMEKL